MIWWWLPLLIGCPDPQQSGPRALVGHLYGPDGSPIAGQVIESIEARSVTDHEGRFSVRFKPPEQYVLLARDGVWYRRHFQEADAGRVVDLRLPETADVTLRCDLLDPCDMRLRWDLGEGLEAWVQEDCVPGRVVELASVPRDRPEGVCRGIPGEQPFEVRVEEERWIALPEPQPVRVELRAEGALPEGCTVRVGAERARPSGEGFWAAEAAGRTTVSATCEARPALPEVVEVLEETSVTLEWSPLGPDLDLAPWAPGVDPVHLLAEEGGWRIALVQGDGGLFRLPPLPRDTYRLVVGDGRVDAEVEDPVPPGSFRLVDLQRGGDGVTTGLTAVLRVEGDLLEGRVPLEGP